MPPPLPVTKCSQLESPGQGRVVLSWGRRTWDCQVLLDEPNNKGSAAQEGDGGGPVEAWHPGGRDGSLHGPTAGLTDLEPNGEGGRTDFDAPSSPSRPGCEVTASWKPPLTCPVRTIFHPFCDRVVSFHVFVPILTTWHFSCSFPRLCHSGWIRCSLQ